MATLANIPQSRIADAEGRITREWLQYFLNPIVQQLVVAGGVSVTSGGTGLNTVPGAGQILVGTGTGYSLVSVLPATAFPALTGDITTVAGALATTLTTVNASVGAFGSGSAVGTFTVNAKGQITAAANSGITGAPGAFTAVGAFGCNAKAAQTAVASGASVVTTASTNIAPFGYVTAAQADRIVALLNTIQAALIANGILS